MLPREIIILTILAFSMPKNFHMEMVRARNACCENCYQSFWHTIKLYLFVRRILQLQSPLEIAIKSKQCTSIRKNEHIVITVQSNQSTKKSMTVSEAPPTKLHTPPILTSQTALRPLEKVQSGIKQCTSVQRINIS